MVPVPSYPLFDHLTRLDGVGQRRTPRVSTARGRSTSTSVDRAWTADTRAVLAVSPNNPTGSVVYGRGAAELVARCAIAAPPSSSTKCSGTIRSTGARSTSSMALRTPPCLVARLGGLSKTVGLPQVKLGWMMLDGPADLVAEARDRLELIADTYLSVSTPVQTAARRLLADGAAVRAAILERIRVNDAALRRRVAASSAVTVLPADGGWSAVLRVPATRSEEDLVLELLEHDSVVVHPGYFFDFAHEAFVVISLLPRAEDFARGRGPHPGACRCRVISSRTATPACWCRSSRSRRGAAGASARSWDLPPLGAWLSDAGFSFVQLLPLNEMADGQNSPYSALSAMAIDPIFIAPAAVPEIEALGGEATPERRRTRPAGEIARNAPAIDYGAVRALKTRCSVPRSTHFLEHEWQPTDGAGAAAAALLERARVVARGLHAVSRAARAGRRRRAWTDWDAPLRDRDPAALRQARASSPARFSSTPTCSGSPPSSGAQARAGGRIGVFGDFPFMVSGDSADVWARQQTSASTPRSARRPTRSPRPGRTGGFPPIAGTPSPATASSGCARAPGAAPSSSTATVSITWSASSAPTSREADGGAAFVAGRRARSDPPGRARARRAQRAGRARSSPKTSASFPTSCASR